MKGQPPSCPGKARLYATSEQLSSSKEASQLFPSQPCHMTQKRNRVLCIREVWKCAFLGKKCAHLSVKASLCSHEPYDTFKSHLNFASTDSELRCLGMSKPNQMQSLLSEAIESGNADRKRLTGSTEPYLCGPITPLLLGLCLPKRIFSHSCLHNTGVYNVQVFTDTTWKLTCCKSSLIKNVSSLLL